MRNKIALLFFCTALLSTSSAQQNTLEKLPQAPLSETKISGPPIRAVTLGDYYSPVFSPDGKKLAFAKVVRQDDQPLGTVLVQDVATGENRTVFPASESALSAANGTSVTRLEWDGPQRIKLELFNGDDGTMFYTYDVESRKKLSERSEEVGIDIEGATAVQSNTATILNAFPNLTRNVVENTLGNNSVALSNGRWLVQKNYHGYDGDIWMWETSAKRQTRVLALPEKWLYALQGGFEFGGAIVFLVQHDTSGYVLAQREGKLTRLATVVTSGTPHLEVQYRDAKRVVFRVVANTGDQVNPLFEYTAAGLARITDYKLPSDVALSADATRVCFVVREGEQGHLYLNNIAGKETR